MSAKVLNRDSKGRFCSACNEALKSMSLLIDRAKQEVDEEVLLYFLSMFYKTNVKFAEKNVKSKTRMNRKIKYRISEPFINFTVYWETV